ncbi:MAG: hypothetical protein KKA19_01795, partial [Candidatus Margulisbacteria bacterium]|nr:hypothetical protein [Candidatus Margulisiibacteriota bacterium]
MSEVFLSTGASDIREDIMKTYSNRGIAQKEAQVNDIFSKSDFDQDGEVSDQEAAYTKKIIDTCLSRNSITLENSIGEVQNHFNKIKDIQTDAQNKGFNVTIIFPKQNDSDQSIYFILSKKINNSTINVKIPLALQPHFTSKPEILTQKTINNYYVQISKYFEMAENIAK